MLFSQKTSQDSQSVLLTTGSEKYQEELPLN